VDVGEGGELEDEALVAPASPANVAERQTNAEELVLLARGTRARIARGSFSRMALRT